MRVLQLSSLKADLAAERAGAWIDAPWEGVAFLVRSINFPAYQNAYDEAQVRLARDFGADVPSDVEARELGALVAEHLLLGWRGLDEGYSAELAIATLTDESFRAMRQAVLLAARKVGRRELAFVEQAEKN